MSNKALFLTMFCHSFVNITTMKVTNLHAQNYTYNAVLDTEAQLIFKIWSLYEDSCNRRTTDNVHLHLNLVLQAL